MALLSFNEQHGSTLMLPIRSGSSYLASVPATATPEQIADAVSRWEARYQPNARVTAPAPPATPAPVPSIAAEPHLKEAAVNWFAEVRQQDQADNAEIKGRVAALMGRRGLVS